MSGNLPPGARQSDIDALIADATPPWEEPGETLVRTGDHIWLQDEYSAPVLVEIKGILRLQLGNIKIWACEVKA